MLPLPLYLSSVLDLTTSVAGVMASRTLADLGAETVVLDRAGTGLRTTAPALVERLQRNKYSLALDLARSDARDVCLRVAANRNFVLVDADDAALAALALDYEAFADGHAALIYVSIRGDGLETGVAAAGGALAALFHRRATGEGQRVDIGTTRLTAGLRADVIAAAVLGVESSATEGGVFACADGSIAVEARNDGERAALATVLGGTGLASWLRERPAAEGARLLLETGVPAQPLLDAAQIVADPHLEARGFFEPAASPSTGMQRLDGVPYRFGRSPAHVRLPAPSFGEHSDVILRAAGLSDLEIASLRSRGVVV